MDGLRKLLLLGLVVLAIQNNLGCSDPEVDYDAICANLEPTGNSVGDVAENWTLLDADGNSHSLHDFCGNVIYLKMGARW